MSTRSRYLLGLGPILLLSSACAPSGGAPVPEPVAPVAAPPDTVVVEVTPADAILEPGRFDTGKMWTFENPPLEYFAEQYDFRPSAEWLDHVRLSSLRLPNCTASFVSSDGLVLTNHHCAREAATAASRDGEDLLESGFYAPTLAEERRVPDLYVDQLVELRDVTDLVEAAVTAMMAEDAEMQAREARQESVADSTSQALGLDCEVQSLYNGGKYSLYCYRRYDDVRLVFIPELDIGYFGGDPDNFTYPRYVLDASFLRVYDESGEPYKPDNHYGWSRSGAREGDAVFVVGNPGSTERLNTVAQLEYSRDYVEPFWIRLYQSRADALAQFMDHHPDQRPEYINDYFSHMNSLKLFKGRYKALQDPEIMGRKRGFERQFRDAVKADPDLHGLYGSLWDEVAQIRAQMSALAPTRNGLWFSGSLWSQTLGTAADMLLYAFRVMNGIDDEVTEDLLSDLEERTFNTDLDRHFLELQLQDAAEWLGDDDPFVRAALAGTTPSEAARMLVNQAVAVTDLEQRKALLGNPTAILNSPDPAVRLMREALPRFIDAELAFQELSTTEEAKVAKLARALFEVQGTALAPDATFTLRIADGVVSSYDYNGTKAPAFTTFYGLYDRHYSHAGSDDWALPERWLNPPAEFDLSTPLNMVHTNDTVGGNSGSPLISIAGDVVGLLFDGNIESLSGDFIYTDEGARSVSVKAEAIIEALRHVYGAQRIVDELLREN
ncbi:MAG: S46 family peptidase [Gemmatimonadota bacterium]|nr:MAG: S46 family peptidase [Gemmatimonadota bacterium]